MIRIEFQVNTPDEAIELLAKVGGATPAAVTSSSADSGAEAPKRGRGRPPKSDAKKADEPAPKAAEPEPPSGSDVTIEDVRTKLNSVVEKKGAKVARDLLQKFASSVSDLKPADYSKVVAAAAELLGEGGGAADDDFLA